jgi:hypothetical protein
MLSINKIISTELFNCPLIQCGPKVLEHAVDRNMLLRARQEV